MTQKTNATELLSPAGNFEALIAAVQNGADAVYLGGTAFSARAGAGNFDNDSLIEAVKYCHVRGVKVFVTLNTLIKQTEFEKAAEFDMPVVVTGDFNFPKGSALYNKLVSGASHRRWRRWSQTHTCP